MQNKNQWNYWQQVRLVALSGGEKNGKKWYRGTFKGHLPDGSPTLTELWLSPAVGDKMKSMGLIEDCDIMVACGLDDFLRLQIVDVLPADEEFSLEPEGEMLP